VRISFFKKLALFLLVVAGLTFVTGIFRTYADVDDSYTKSLLHFNGTDASTTFTDDSGKTWTANGNAQLDTAQSKFGGSSGLFDGTGDYIDTPDHADFTVGSGNFTFEMFIKRNTTGSGYLFGQSNSAGDVSSQSVNALFTSTDHLRLDIYGSGNYQADSTGTITDSNWHHVAFVRNGNTGTIYIDGTADGTVDLTGVTVNDSSNKFAIGRHGERSGSGHFNGWIDEFRFSKGIARWTSNFTPTTQEYAPSPTATPTPTPAPASGWNSAGESWTYASSTTITVPSDATTKYSLGDKIRLKQGGGYKYFYVTDLTSTVLTVTGGSDYSVANASITDNDYSKVVTPVGFPQYFNWSPTYSITTRSRERSA
jgi:Concanavalin A-like lectin/glucanases superfamily